MRFSPTPIPDVWVIDIEPHEDERGYFARTWCRREFAEHGLDTEIAQASISSNRRRGTLRGLHYQAAPHGETKIVRCIQGAIFDVVVDLRKESATHLKHVTAELTARNCRALYVPEGFAHGFQTLEDSTVVAYQMSTPYVPEAARGARWNDPAFGIAWPIPDPIMNARDRDYPDYPAAGR